MTFDQTNPKLFSYEYEHARTHIHSCYDTVDWASGSAFDL